MELEKIFKNLILVDFVFLILIVLSSMLQANDLTEINNYLEKGFLNIIFFVSYNFNFTLSFYFIRKKSLYFFNNFRIVIKLF